MTILEDCQPIISNLQDLVGYSFTCKVSSNRSIMQFVEDFANIQFFKEYEKYAIIIPPE
jgi:hypothetical protein